MLSEAVLASMADRPKKTRSRFGLSLVSSCPMYTYLNFLNFREPEEVSPFSRLVMEDGEFQEQSVLYWLRQAGFTIFYTGKDQMEVHSGRLNIPGHPDGILVLNSGLRLLEIKGMNFSRFSNAKSSGLEKHQSIRCQIQSYMASKELRDLGINTCQIYFKHKETSKPCDIEIEYDPNWINPILETTCDILEGSFVPQPIEIEMCESCRKSEKCWPDKVPTIDFTQVEYASMPDMEEQYDKGKYYESLGKMLKEEAKEAMVQRLGDKNTMFLEHHKLQWIRFGKRKFNESAFIKKFGAENLELVIDKNPVEYVRVDSIGED